MRKLYVMILLSILMPTPTPTPAQGTKEPMPQGISPFAIAITKDGKYAYVSFDLAEVVFKVCLANFTVKAMADLANYFPMESEHIALDANEKKLFVHSRTWRKLLVLDTQTMGVIHAIDNISATGMLRSQNGPFLIIWDGGNTVKFVSTETYEVREFRDERIGFLEIQESKHDQGKWYVVTQEGPEGHWVVGTYDYKAKAWTNKVSFPPQAKGECAFDFKVLPNEQKAYMAIMGGWYLDYHAYGWLYSVDLTGGEVKVIPVDGGALCLEASSDSQRLYVGTNLPKPNVNNLLVVDTQSDTILGPISLGQNKYGWHYTAMNDLQIDSANPNLLYATSCDGNAFIKVNLDSLTLADVLVFNEESFQPSFFVKQPAQSTGYILIHQSAKAFELDLDKAIIRNVVTFSSICADVYSYDAAIDNDGRLLIAHVDSILEVDPQDMRLLGTHPLPPEIPAVLHFVLSNDKTKLYAISEEHGTKEEWHPEVFLAINITTFQVEACFRLDGGGFNERPYELPDGSKLYVLGGWDNGPVVIHVIRTDNYTVQKTITFQEPGLTEGISAGPYYPFAYDSGSRTLFMGAAHVVLAIDTDRDVIEKVIHLRAVTKAIGLKPLYINFTFVNAIGMVYHPEEDYLYIAHLDRSFVSIYDLKNDRFLPQVIPLNGYFPIYVFANDDLSKIYTLNVRSDTVSVIDVKSKALEKVIDLHGGWVSIRTMPEEASIVVDNVQYKGGDAFEWTRGSVHTISAPEFVPLGEGERLLFSEWNDGNKSLSRSVRVAGPASYVAAFKKQYYLTVISDYGSPTGSGWYADGANATVSLVSGEVPAEFPYANIFVGWSGDAQDNYPSSSILIDGPKTAIARWERRLSSSFYVLCLGGISFGMALMAVLLLKRKSFRHLNS